MTPPRHPSAIGPGTAPRTRGLGRRRRVSGRIQRRLAAWVGCLVASTGCAGGGGVATVAPLADPQASLRAFAAETTPESPTRIYFDWSLTEEGVRVSGRGVARVAPPDRARLDLFLSNGEAVAGAILVGDELTLPVSLPGDILPPPELLWGTIGTIRLGAGARVVGGDELEDGGVRLVARLSDGEAVRYEVLDGRVRRIEQVTEGGSVVKTLVTRHADEGRIPAEATYRDLTAFRELILTRDGMENVDGFPADIWHY